MKAEYSSRPSLARLQQWLSQAIAEPECRETLKKLCPYLAGSRPWDAKSRVGVYRFAYSERLFESLCAEYPSVFARLGESGFRKLSREYLSRNPSRTYTVTDVGERLPRFLKAHSLSRRYPEIADLAKLDRSCTRAFHARDPLVFDPEAWAKNTIKAGGRLRFELGESVSLIRSAWKLEEFRSRKKGRVSRAPRTLVVYRAGFEVRVEAWEGCRFSLLYWASRGMSLGEICAKMDREKKMDPARFGEEVRNACALGILVPIASVG